MNNQTMPGTEPGQAKAAPSPAPETPRSDSASWHKNVPTGTAASVFSGLLVMAAFIAAFGVWAVTAPLSGAALAVGIVQAKGQNQVVEHLEGGIIREIRAREGDRIAAGDVVMVLDDTRANAELNRVNVALVGARASLARAQAERSGATELQFDAELTAAAGTEALEADLDQQRFEFANRYQRHVSQLGVLDQRVQASREEIEGLSIQKGAEERKLAVIRRELVDKQVLLAKGLTPKSLINDLERAEADSLGRIGGLTASMAQRKTAIAEIEEQRTGLEAQRREAASTEINELRSKIGDMAEQLRARVDVMTRMIIRAPADGIVLRLAKNTVGSVVKPGEAVVEILPTSDGLIVDARIRPTDIDSVKVGQEAELRLVALNQRTTPEVGAVVTYISADRIVDPQSRESYYTARLKMDQNLPPQISLEQIYPGMPVDAFIKTGDRTFLEYLVRPIRDSFAKAFREE